MRLFRIFSLAILSVNIAYATIDLTIPLQELETNGFTVLHHVLSPQDIQELSTNFHKAKEKAFHIIEGSPPVVRHFSENNTQNQSIYWKTDRELILQAGKGRYDFYRGFQDDFFHSDRVLHNQTLEALMRNLMIDEFTNYSGVVHSTVGSLDQYWHRDTHTLTNFGSDGSKLVTMDDFYFTILIPITVPFTKENGTTEFLVGSHRLPSSDFDKCPHAQVEVPLGSVLVFNGKINHRGRANLSDEDRPALYLVYHKKWYNDQYRRGVPD